MYSTSTGIYLEGGELGDSSLTGSVPPPWNSNYHPRWKGSHRAHSREHCVRVLFVHPWYAILCSCHARHDEQDQHIPRLLNSISHLLCAMLVLGSARCNTENSVLITPVSASVACTVIACRGVGRWSMPYSSKFLWHNIFMNFTIWLLIMKVFLTKI